MRRRLLYGTFGVLVATPFAVTACGSGAPPPVSTTAPAQDRSGAPVPTEASSSAAEPPATPPPSTPPLPPEPEAIASSPPGSAKECKAIEASIAQAFGEVRCSSDQGCAIGHTYCSCGAAIASSALPKLERANRAWNEKRCVERSPPRPCPSCAFRAPPKCVGGKCTL